MRSLNELKRNGFSVYVGCGILCAVFFGLFMWQPKVGGWAAEAVEAESSKMLGEPEFTGSVSMPVRKPIGPTAWTRVVTPRVKQASQSAEAQSPAARTETTAEKTFKSREQP